MASSISARPETGAAVDVLVVGAGPGGSATAAGLARQGWRVVLVDRAAFPRDKACSEYLGPGTVRLLDRLGVAPALDGAGAALLGAAITAPRGSRLHGRFALAGTALGPAGLSVSRRILDQALVDAAGRAGAPLWERAGVEELLYDGGAVAGVMVRDAEGRRHAIRARLTIGADGLRSTVARRIGRRRHGRLRRLAFVAHVDGVAGLVPGTCELHVGRQGYVGLNAIGGGCTNVAVVVPAARGADARGRAEAFFWETLETFPGVAGRVAGGSLARKVLATGPFAAWSGRVVADGAALVGDAADFFDPFTGEGIYSALRGAELLAETAGKALAAEADGPVSAAGLAGYRRARRRTFAGKWAVERLIGYGMLAPALFDRVVGRLGRRAGMADTLIGVTGDFVPARRVLNPLFLARMLV
jgi:2-polyprenyl-6-methoxyphenol hydroxylase-like FAD-dependent oxidoreductase